MAESPTVERQEISGELTADLLARLRFAGFRVTPQKLAVYEFLMGSRCHPSVDMIYEDVKKKHPQVSLATVYKAVESLVEVGLVKRIHRGSSAARYDAAPNDHAHFRCVSCDEIVDINLDKGPLVRGGLDRFEVIGANVEFYGYCSRCRRRRLGLSPECPVTNTEETKTSA